MSIRVPPRGTRGVPFPKLPTWIASFVSRLQLRRFRRRGGGHTQGGVQSLILETVGARSGETRYAMLGYLDEGGGSWLVIASLGGAARHPGWLYNLARQPDAEIEFGDGRRVNVRGETLEGAPLEEAWRRIGVDAPEYDKYRSKTDRDIPVVRLRQRP